jgi:hypothetical protein
MPNQGETYGVFIESQLQREFDRREKADSRGLTIIASSTGLITISVAGVALLKGKEYVFSGFSVTSLGASLAAFLIAAILGILTAANRPYSVASIKSLNLMTTDHWTDSEITARNYSAKLNIRTLATLREVNNRKAWLLTAALVAQVVAILLLAAAVGQNIWPEGSS